MSAPYDIQPQEVDNPGRSVDVNGLNISVNICSSRRIDMSRVSILYPSMLPLFPKTIVHDGTLVKSTLEFRRRAWSEMGISILVTCLIKP